MMRFVGATRVSPQLLEPSASGHVLTCRHTVPDHPRNEPSRPREDPTTLKKSRFAGFHCTRKVPSPDASLRALPGQPDTCNEA